MTHNRPTGKNRLSLAWSQLLRLIGQPRPPATRRPYPKLRNFILDVMAEGRRKNIINLLFEADVTSLRTRLARHREQTGEHLSLTACLAGTLAAAIEEDRSMQAYRQGLTPNTTTLMLSPNSDFFRFFNQIGVIETPPTPLDPDLVPEVPELPEVPEIPVVPEIVPAPAPAEGGAVPAGP